MEIIFHYKSLVSAHLHNHSALYYGFHATEQFRNTITNMPKSEINVYKETIILWTVTPFPVHVFIELNAD